MSNSDCSQKTVSEGSACSLQSPVSSCCPGPGGSRICPEGESYVKKITTPKIAVMACEGACIKGEIARVAANILAYQLERNSAVRICLGDAATGKSGFLDLMQQAPKILAIEGCFLRCGNEIMKMRVPSFTSTIIEASSLYSYDKERIFEIFDMPRTEIEEIAQKIAENIQQKFFNDENQGNTSCCSSPK
ncbi:MAG: putative zinc-binding protein [Bacillota bacterium]